MGFKLTILDCARALLSAVTRRDGLSREKECKGARLRICHDGQAALPALCESGSPGAAMFYFFIYRLGAPYGGHDIRVQPQPAIPDLDNLNTSLPRAGPLCKFLYTGGFGTIRYCLFLLLTPFALVVGGNHRVNGLNESLDVILKWIESSRTGIGGVCWPVILILPFFLVLYPSRYGCVTFLPMPYRKVRGIYFASTRITYPF